MEKELSRYHKSQLLLDMVDNLEDGVVVLNENGLKSDVELQMLRQVKRDRDEKIRKMNTEMARIKVDVHWVVPVF